MKNPLVSSGFEKRKISADRTGLEPATSAVTGRHSNQLNYRSISSKTCSIGIFGDGKDKGISFSETKLSSMKKILLPAMYLPVRSTNEFRQTLPKVFICKLIFVKIHLPKIHHAAHQILKLYLSFNGLFTDQ